MPNPADVIDLGHDWAYAPPTIVQLPDGRKRIALSAMTRVGNIVQGIDPDFALELAEALKQKALEAGARAKSGLVVSKVYPTPNERAVNERLISDAGMLRRS